MPINKVGTVCVFVSDQNRAKTFYTDQLGMELRMDSPLYPGAPSRWVAVAPHGAETDIILYLPDENWNHYRQVVGKSQAVTLDVTDMDKVVAGLKAKGVKFVQEPEAQPWAPMPRSRTPKAITYCWCSSPAGAKRRDQSVLATTGETG